MTSDVTSCEVIQWQFVCQLRIPPTLLAIQHCQRMNHVIESTCFNIQVFFLFLYRFNLKNMVAEYISPLQLPVQAQLRSVQGPSHWSLWSIVLQHKHQMKYDKWHLTSDITAAQFPAMTSDIWWHLTIPKYDKWHLTSDITAAQFPAMTSDIWWHLTSHYSQPSHWKFLPLQASLGLELQAVSLGLELRDELHSLGLELQAASLGLEVCSWDCDPSGAGGAGKALGPQGLSVESMIRSQISSRTFIIWDQSSFNCFRHSTPQRSAKSVTFNTFSDIFCKYHEAM